MNENTKGVDVLEVMGEDSVDAYLCRMERHGRVSALVDREQSRAALFAVAELIEADREYDVALAAFNNTAATRPDWPQFHERFQQAKVRRDAALARVGGGK